MFRILKSKKGFTLVELMIVVVIMAILVAVAVPVYSAVTSNSKKKTCASNRRTISEQLSNFCAGSMTADPYFLAAGDTDTIVITSDTESGTYVSGTGPFNETLVTNLFQRLPYCPGGGSYTITLIGSGEDIAPKIQIECDYNTDEHA